jgi:hypothetical protein
VVEVHIDSSISVDFVLWSLSQGVYGNVYVFCFMYIAVPTKTNLPGKQLRIGRGGSGGFVKDILGQRLTVFFIQLNDMISWKTLASGRLWFCEFMLYSIRHGQRYENLRNVRTEINYTRIIQACVMLWVWID